ncbi:hypothetical protein AVDCRST_MAG84-2568 [uncultured Microcoleus sp.]|uniref:Uncharacterized protein n=1 Tax=uncultured Microcoleus sp. TaxID=259945 RepID=A0A6J4LZC5_9CYAN|nr:hypothetical protein AVDCRST_MAG84-2568 [uncultured Microcoleus sp.]
MGFLVGRGRVFYIVGLSQRWLVKPAPTHRFFCICGQTIYKNPPPPNQ